MLPSVALLTLSLLSASSITFWAKGDGFLGTAREKQRAEAAGVGLSHSLDLSASGG